MKTIHSTDFLAVITKVQWASPVMAKPIYDEVIHQRKETCFYFLDLAIAAAIVLATEMLNWSH